MSIIYLDKDTINSVLLLPNIYVSLEKNINKNTKTANSKSLILIV